MHSKLDGALSPAASHNRGLAGGAVQAVVRALCSAFPLNKEPAMCNSEAVSENECKPGGVGYHNCHNGCATVLPCSAVLQPTTWHQYYGAVMLA